MASFTAGYSFGSTETVTNTKLGLLVSSATISGIVNSEIDASAAIANSKLNLASISQAIAMSGGLTLSTSGLTMTSVAANFAKGSDIASATTTDIGAATGNYVHVTGTTTITGLGTVQAGTWRLVRFTGALTLTHNGTSLILPTAANITTAADDHALMISLGSGNWICANYARKSGVPLVAFTASTAPAGTVLQVVNTKTVTSTTGTTAIPYDDTIPQSNEGDEYMTRAITPNSATNKLLIEVVINGSNSNTEVLTAALFQDSTADALACAGEYIAANELRTISFANLMDAGTTSSTTFKVRMGGHTGATTTFNGSAGARKFGGVLTSSITITEIKV